ERGEGGGREGRPAPERTGLGPPPAQRQLEETQVRQEAGQDAESAVLPAAAIGDHLQPRRDLLQQPGAEQQGPDAAVQGLHQDLPGAQRIVRPGPHPAGHPRRRDHLLGLGGRPRHLPGERADPGAPDLEGAGHPARPGRPADRPEHRRARSWRPRRPRRERARANRRPGQGVPAVPDNNRRRSSMFDRELLVPALWASVKKLNPRHQIRNPVMFVVEVGALITTIGWVSQAFGNAPLGGGAEPAWFTFPVAIWLWLTVVFANLAEALAEGRGKAQADALRAARTETVAHLQDGREVTASELQKG